MAAAAAPPPLLLLLLLALAAARPAAASLPPTLALVGADLLVLRNGHVQLSFNLTRGSLDIVQARFEGDGDFSASPNLAGAQGAPAGSRRGAAAVVVSGLAGGGGETSTASFDRAAPLAFSVLFNDSSAAGFSVTLTDARADGAGAHLAATLSFALRAAAPRAFELNASAVARAAFAPTVVALSTLWTPPSATGFYYRGDAGPLGVRQGMAMAGGLIASASPLRRAYLIGDGATGAVEVLPLSAPAGSSFLFGGKGSLATNGGVGVAMWGSAQPADQWVADFDSGSRTSVPLNGASAPVALAVFPNDRPFPTSQVPEALPAKVVLDDLQAALQAAHGAVVAPLHSYDFYPEVRAAPCLDIGGSQCYAPLYNFYDPDSGISNSALLYTFDAQLHEQVRGQLETNMARVCPDNAHPDRCIAGQCIHHFTDNCNGQGAECYCVDNPNGVRDCVFYDSIAGGVQTGPNIFTTLAALRYAGASGNQAWLAARMPQLRSMIDFLEPLYDTAVGLYNVPGSLQIDVFIRANFTADSNAMFIILFELFADAETSVGNATGAAFCTGRAAALRVGMNKHLLSPEGDHYCTQSDPMPDGSVKVCARDFVDYDANAIAIAARVPASAAAANRIFARMDGGKCTHAGRATYVSEVFYDKENCVGGNTGDSAVAMGRIGWQDALARQAVGDAAAAATFSDVLLAPLQRDLLRRTWLPERFNCDGTDAHNSYYFEYPATVSLMLYEVKYGISLQMTRVLVNPLAAPSSGFDYFVGALWISYSPTAFHATLPPGHSGSRAFTVTRVQPGAWTVKPSGSDAFPVTVKADGVLSFSAAVGGGAFVDAVRTG